MTAVTIKVSVYTNSDDAFVAWSPSIFIPECRGFMLERQQGSGATAKTVIVENRVGFGSDNPKSGDHRPSNDWPLQRFNWTDHAVDVGSRARYRVTAMLGKAGERPFKAGPQSDWTAWATLSPDAGDGFSCFFNRGLVLSQFVARYMRDKHLSPKKFKDSLRQGTDEFRKFLMGDLGAQMFRMLEGGKKSKKDFYAALYELEDEALEDALIALKSKAKIVLSNGSGKNEDGNEKSRKHLNDEGIETVDRLLRSKGLGHNKFVSFTDDDGRRKAWTGSTNWATTGLCTQINNGLLIDDQKIADHYRDQWNLLKDASPPETDPADFTDDLVNANDTFRSFKVGKSKIDVDVWFTRTSDGRDMDALKALIAGARDSILFLMFTPGKDGLHIPIAKRSAEKNMYVRGVVSTLGNQKGDSAKNVLDVQIYSSDQTFKPDHYTVVQPQGQDALGPWIASVNRSTFLSQIGHAIVHTKAFVIDALSDHPIVVTGSHNMSAPASGKNDENFVIVRGHKQLATAYAAHIMSVYQHYRYRSYIRETLAEGKKPWSYLDDNDQWLKDELVSKAQEIGFWA